MYDLLLLIKGPFDYIFSCLPFLTPISAKDDYQTLACDGIKFESTLDENLWQMITFLFPNLMQLWQSVMPFPLDFDIDLKISFIMITPITIFVGALLNK